MPRQGNCDQRYRRVGVWSLRVNFMKLSHLPSKCLRVVAVDAQSLQVCSGLTFPPQETNSRRNLAFSTSFLSTILQLFSINHCPPSLGPPAPSPSRDRTPSLLSKPIYPLARQAPAMNWIAVSKNSLELRCRWLVIT